MCNAAYSRLVALLGGGTRLEPYEVLPQPRLDVLKGLFGPFRPLVVNWEEAARDVLERAQREAASDRDPARRQVIAECLALAPGEWRRPRSESSPRLVVTVDLRLGEARARLFSTITTLGTAQDITLQELHIESFHLPTPRPKHCSGRWLFPVDGAGEPREQLAHQGGRRVGGAMQLTVNGTTREVDAPEEMPLLWVLRDVLGMTGTKFGCGMAQCGACTVHLDGEAVRSCVLPVSAVAGRKITTIEGLSEGGTHPVQQAWAEVDVVQCGYCQSGQIMSAAALLAHTPDPTDQDIDLAMAGNICRCGTYQRIREAVRKAASQRRAAR